MLLHHCKVHSVNNVVNILKLMLNLITIGNYVNDMYMT